MSQTIQPAQDTSFTLDKVNRVKLSLNEPHHVSTMKKLLTFTDRASYFEWFAQWSAARNFTIEQVRTSRHKRKYGENENAKGVAQVNREIYRTLGHNLYLIRILSKIQAGEQSAEIWAKRQELNRQS